MGMARKRQRVPVRAFAEAFNAGRYFEAHELLEDFWREHRGPDRAFYQGLIQVAVALHHHERGNAVGAARVASRARRNLAPWLPSHAGFDVARLLADLEASLSSQAPSPVLEFGMGGARERKE